MKEEREGEKHQSVVAYHGLPTGDLARNPGMCPDWESNQWPFGLQASAQSTEPHQPGLYSIVLYWVAWFSSTFVLHPFDGLANGMEKYNRIPFSLPFWAMLNFAALF